ncbi:hypothetical protein BDV12DRAFT_162798 [Aspergillus spectabilis]
MPWLDCPVLELLRPYKEAMALANQRQESKNRAGHLTLLDQTHGMPGCHRTLR